MKKLYLFFAVLCSLLGTQTANAATFEKGKTYYLRVTDDWKENSARFAARFWTDNGGEKWYDMTFVYGESHVLKVTLNEDWEKVIFCRMNGSQTANNWDNKWNQTSDIASSTSNMYEITGWDKSGKWASDYCYYLVGDFNSWKQTAEYKLSDNGFGVFIADKVTFSSKTSGELKVESSVGTWYGNNSSSFKFQDAQTSTAGLSADIYAGQNNIDYDLPSEYSVKFTLGSSKHTLAFTKTSSSTPTETSRTLKSIVLHKSGGSDIPFEKSSDGLSWTFEGETVTVGSSNSYYITASYEVQWSNGDVTTETKNYNIAQESSINGKQTGVTSGTEYSLYERTDDYFYFDFPETTVDATLTLTEANGVPSKVTFTKVTTGGGDDPVKPTTYAEIWLVNMNGTKLAKFTQDSTYPYIYTLSSHYISTASNDNDKQGHYRFRIYTSETDATQYSEFSMGDNYGYLGNYGSTDYYGLRDVTGNNTASFGLPSGTYYFAVTTYGGELCAAKISNSAIDLTKLPDPTPEVETDETSELLNMPLKRRDFVDGDDNPIAHYFVVGTRMSEWRLQPEWELTDEDGDGVYTLDNRLLYTGMMGIAMVDNYDDYIHQRYTFYTKNQAISGTSDVNITLSTITNPKADVLVVTCAESNNKFTAINYGKDYTHGQFKESNTIIWGHGDTDLEDADILQSQPTYVGTIGFNATTKALTMTNISTDASVVAQYRTFSLVGSDVIYAFDEGTNDTAWNKATPAQNDKSYKIDSWQESWIQYDGLGKPYFDAYGNTLYQTVFQREWLEKHPTRFRTADGFEYNSIGVVFNFDEDQGHAATIPDTSNGEEAWATKDSSTSSPNKSYSVTNTDDWQCFVVDNLWLSGNFKVWTGWGGANKKHDGSGTGTTDARWNYENGGHHVGSPWTISANEKIYYATMRDVNKADYSLGDNRIFARYVKVWWNPSQGFTGSFIQLITEEGGPQIECKRNPDKEHSLMYKWSVPEENLALSHDVKNIKIIRYRIDANKKETELEISNTSYEKGKLNGKDVNTVFTKLDSDGDGYLDDPNEAEGGYYWYQVIIDYYGNEAATNKEDFSRDAKSNRVYIYFETIPQGATVKQLAYSDRGATERVPEPMASDTEEFDPYEVSSVAEDETYWSFDLAVTAYPHESLYDKTFEKGNEDGTTTETEVLSLVKYYVVGVPKNADYAVYTTARVGGENGTIVNPLTDAQMDSIKSSADALEFKPENYTYFGVKPDVKNHYAMPELILHNVVPDKYLKLDGKNFTIDMVASNGDYGEWEKTNVKTSYPEVVMYVPSTGYDLSKFNVVRATDYKGVKDAPEIHLGASKAQPVAYHAFNKLQTSEAKIKQLMVTNGVLDAWTVTYGLDMTIKDANGSTNLPVTLYYTGSNSYLNQMGGIDANFDYLPVPVATTKDYDNDTDTGISAIDDWQTRYFDASDFSVDMTVMYTRNDDIDNPDNNPSVDAAPSTFTEIINKTSNGENNVTDLDKLVAYVNAALASNGYTVHNLGAWSSQTSDGEVIYYLDAFKAINLNNSDNTLAKTVGYYSSNGYEPTVTYYKETPDAGYQPFEAVPGGEVIIPATEEEYSAPFDEFYGIGSNNFAEYAAEKGVLPIKIGFVGEGSSEIANITDKDELLKAIKALDIAPIYTLVTAEYPFLVKPTFTQGEGAASEYDGYDLVTLAYPFVVGASDSDITTETINIAVDGASDFRIYPNPAVDVVNVAASAELGTIEIYSIDGRLVKVIEVDDTRAAIEVGDLAKGNYIVRAAGATQRMIKM